MLPLHFKVTCTTTHTSCKGKHRHRQLSAFVAILLTGIFLSLIGCAPEQNESRHANSSVASGEYAKLTAIAPAGSAPALKCPKELTDCGTGTDGNEVCCAAKSQCVAATSSSPLHCGQEKGHPGCHGGAYRCGTTCCTNGQYCSAATSTCSYPNECGADAVLCGGVPGGCCKSGEQCMQSGQGTSATFSCAPANPPGRCTAPQTACGTDPMAKAPATLCCNPGLICSVTSATQAGCCMPGMTLDPVKGACTGGGPNTCTEADGTTVLLPTGAVCCGPGPRGKLFVCLAPNTCSADKKKCVLATQPSGGQ